MPRPKNALLHDLFNRNNLDEFICKNGNCNGKVLNKHSGNLERHLKTVHPKMYSKYLVKKTSSKSKSKDKTKTIPSKKVNKRNIELAIVELFTKNERPLQMAGDRAFKVLVQPVFNMLNIDVNEQTITEQIISFSNMLKAEIVADVKGKLLSLKIDAATKEDVNVLGIHLQYVENNKITIKTLAIRQLRSSTTSEYLKSIVLEVLQEYSIDVNQILTITTDNGANMLKAVNKLNNVLQNSLEEDQVQDDLNLTAESLDAMRNKFASYSITSVQCGAQILQLCVQDALRKEEIKQKIDKCRIVAKKLRTLTYLNILKSDRSKKPIIDFSTTWNSTFDMLENLLAIRETIDSMSSENEDLLMSNDLWIFVEEFIKTFRPLYTALKKLQSEQLCFSELYVIIMDIIIQTENASFKEISIPLAEALNKQKSKLFENELFNASVFLDPRLKICLDSHQILRAEQYVVSLHQRIVRLRENLTTSTDILLQPKTERIDEPSTSKVAVSKTFSEYLQMLDPIATEELVSPVESLKTDIFKYKRQPRYPIDTNILDFWFWQKSSLAIVANVVLAIPSTQVSVERLFSSINYILSDERDGLSSTNLEHILLVKANGEFKYED